MSAPRHVVRRQRYELTVDDPREAAGTQERMRETHEHRVLPEIDALLSTLASGDDVYLFDRVELDLGTLEIDRIEDELGALVVARLAEALRAGLGGARHRAEGGARAIEASRVSLELLREFLQSGALPWWAPVGARSSLGERFVEALDTTPEALVEMLRSVRHPALARRVVKQFAPAEVTRVVGLLAGPSAVEWRETIDEWVACLVRSRDPEQGSSRTRDEITIEALDVLLTGSIDPTELGERLLTRLSRDRGRRPSEWTRKLEEGARGSLAPGSPVLQWLVARSRGERTPGVAEAPPPTAEGAARSGIVRDVAPPADPDADPRGVAPGGSGLLDARTSRLGRTTTGPTPPSAGVGSPSGDRAPPGDRGGIAPERHGTQGGARDREGTEGSPGAGPVVDPEVGALVADAGLVLAWPFLPRFFGEVELLYDDAFVSDAAREHAVLMLHHFVTGDTEIPECDLLLDKLLCGWPLEEPVTRRIAPTERESRAVDELLASILENWKALGSTSPEGLRASFLAREGLLHRRELGWNLKVDRRGYDILLGQLPWGLGVVKLAWMDEPLMVEW